MLASTARALEGSKDICVMTLALGLNLRPELLGSPYLAGRYGIELLPDNGGQAFKMF